jgi:hypothetical protein
MAQPKIGQGAGQSPAISAQREALGSCLGSLDSQSSPLPILGESEIRALAEFIKTLDLWDREAHGIFTM